MDIYCVVTGQDERGKSVPVSPGSETVRFGHLVEIPVAEGSWSGQPQILEMQ